MVAFVSKDQARDQMRLDGDADDSWLDTWIPLVSGSVAAWLKDDWRVYVLQRDAAGSLIRDEGGRPLPVLDQDEQPVVHPAVVAATLLELASQYRYREGEGENGVPGEAGHGYVLSLAATAQLAPLRRSTVA